jgi:hypothetical protein
MSFAAHITPTAVFQSAGFLADIGDGAATSSHHATGRAATPCAGFLADIGDGTATAPHHATGRAATHLDTGVCYPSRRALALTWLYSCDDMVS